MDRLPLERVSARLPRLAATVSKRAAKPGLLRCLSGSLISASLAAGISATASAADPELPPANAAVVRFCEDHLGKKVGDGQCAALVDQALRAADAHSLGDAGPGPDRGTQVERPDDALPGDIVRFRDVTVLTRTPNGVKIVRTFPDHAAVVAGNRGAGRFDLYEQNVAAPGGNSARQGKTRRLALDLRGMIRGEVKFFRPKPKAAPIDDR